MIEGPSLDRRLHAYRPDLADIRLKDEVEAERYVVARPGFVIAPLADLRPAPDAKGSLDTQLLFGEAVRIYERGEAWAWVQSETDGYVGYARATAIATGRPPPARHRVDALSTPLFPAPDIKAPARGLLSLMSPLAVAEIEGRFARLVTGGWVVARHLVPLETVSPDPVETARLFLGAPYVWGGRSSHGLDCSALVQLALARAGRTSPRDTDMQARALARPLEEEKAAALRPAYGDILYMAGHVAFALDAESVLHANAHHMAVTIEPLGDLLERVRAESGRGITGIVEASA